MKNNQFIFLKNSIQLSWLKSSIYLIVVVALSGCVEDQNITDGFNRVTQSFLGGEMEFSCNNTYSEASNRGMRVSSRYKITKTMFADPKVFKEIEYKWEPIDAKITENSLIISTFYFVNGLPLAYLNLNDLDIPDPLLTGKNINFSYYSFYSEYIEKSGNNNNKPSIITEINFGSRQYKETLSDEAINYIKLSDSYRENTSRKSSISKWDFAAEEHAKKMVSALEKYGISYRIKTPANTVFDTGQCFL